MLGCNRCGHIWDNCECTDKEVIGADRDMFESAVCEHELDDYSFLGCAFCRKCGEYINRKTGEVLTDFEDKIDNKNIEIGIVREYPFPNDLGSHYRHSFMGHKIDVYRVLDIFGVTDPVAQHIVKKLLRGTKKGHTEEFVWQEVTQAVERKNEMIKEDKING